VPRCAFAGEQCREIDMSLAPVTGEDPDHLTACPFVRPPVAAGKTPEATTGGAR
jgi:hypothetical protein